MLKRLSKTVLTALGLKRPASALWRKLAPPAEHGHVLMLRVLQRESRDARGRFCVEIGSTREELPGQGSTNQLASACYKAGLRFVTVDMDPGNTERASAALKSFSPEFRAVNRKGEEFLAELDEPVHYLYLDAFDYEHRHHSEQRRDHYLKYLGTDINDEACHRMHLDCARQACRLMPLRGVIVFDDVWRVGGGWGGKGTTAVPYLLEHGFRVEETTATAVALRRVAGPSALQR